MYRGKGKKNLLNKLHSESHTYSLSGGPQNVVADLGNRDSIEHFEGVKLSFSQYQAATHSITTSVTVNFISSASQAYFYALIEVIKNKCRPSRLPLP